MSFYFAYLFDTRDAAGTFLPETGSMTLALEKGKRKVENRHEWLLLKSSILA